jgi:hypothetical protein
MEQRQIIDVLTEEADFVSCDRRTVEPHVRSHAYTHSFVSASWFGIKTPFCNRDSTISHSNSNFRPRCRK